MADEPISYAQAKAQCRLDSDDEQALIEGLIVAARQHVEDYTGLVLTSRSVVETASGFGCWIDLSSWPVRSVTSISYLDQAGVAQAVAPAGWYGAPGKRPYRIRPIGQWAVAGYAIDAVFPVTITVDAGFATPDDVPQTVKQAILLLIGHWYANREAVAVGATAAAATVPFAVDALLRRWRVVTI